MENSGDLELQNLINELTQGRELAKQLQISLNTPSSSDKTRDFLIQRIENSYEKVLSILNNGDDLDREFKDQNASRKRKAMPTSTKKVQLCPGIELEEQLDDGYSWKKYGQKDILGATYPRGYYRCSHGRDQGCLAAKKVQRSDNDPTVFEITYVGGHTCSHVSCSNPAPTLPQNCIFPDTIMDNDVLGTFMSPPMSESNYFTVSPTLMSNYGGYQNAVSSESQLITPFAPSPTISSGTNIPNVGTYGNTSSGDGVRELEHLAMNHNVLPRPQPAQKGSTFPTRGRNLMIGDSRPKARELDPDLKTRNEILCRFHFIPFK
ncbi:putative WRKY transcription factor 30 [Forsythia ovata]|uniref:WRKY transcription factor 30 n=1 Tax=Forsythia ovata TaxID=205694 RepID=A0ABD1X2H5_9LAMI